MVEASHLVSMDTINPLSTEGLENFFDVQPLDLDRTGLKIKEAALFFGLSPAEIKRRVREGTLPAIRVGEGKERKWRVFPNGVPAELSEPKVLPVPRIEILGTTPEPGLVDELKAQVQQLQARLESAAYRNGYLEAKVSQLEERLRLIGLKQDTPQVPTSIMRKLRQFLGF